CTNAASTPSCSKLNRPERLDRRTSSWGA
ncbi:hypothetical protein D049_0389, partial [Vibrio parahaemolyticus VPTS-2010]